MTKQQDEDRTNSSDEKIDKYIKEFIDSELEYDTVSTYKYIHVSRMEMLCIKYLLSNSDIHINELIDCEGDFIFHYKLEHHLKAKNISYEVDYGEDYFHNVVLKKKKC